MKVERLYSQGIFSSGYKLKIGKNIRYEGREILFQVGIFKWF